MIFIPPPIVVTRKCQRCKLRYPRKLKQCPHCSHLSDRELRDLQAHYREERKGNARLGRFMIFAAFLIMMLLLYLKIS